jgi:hypothetical protein
MILITNYLFAFLHNFSATLLIYTGVFFMPAALFPKYLAFLYKYIEYIANFIPFVSAYGLRSLLAIAILFFPANILISTAFSKYPAMAVSITNIIAVVIILITIAITKDELKNYLNPTTYIWIFILIFACIMITANVEKAKSAKELQKITQTKTTTNGE